MTARQDVATDMRIDGDGRGSLFDKRISARQFSLTECRGATNMSGMRSLSIGLMLIGALLLLVAATDLFQTGGVVALGIGAALFISGSIFAAAASIRDAMLR